VGKRRNGVKGLEREKAASKIHRLGEGDREETETKCPRGKKKRGRVQVQWGH